MTRLLTLLRDAQANVESVVGIEDVRRQRINEITRLATFDDRGSLQTGSERGVIDLTA